MKPNLERRIGALEAKAGSQKPASDLFSQMKRYEEIYKALDAGLPLDANDPEVKDCLEHEQYFAELEAMRCRQIA